MWNSNHPVYNFRSIIPITFTTAFRDRLKDNYVIIETWAKATSEDQLLGLTKLPTNQIYLSFNDEHFNDYVAEEYPIIAVDGYMPITNIVSNEKAGMLQCILAVGTVSQCQKLLAEKQFLAKTVSCKDTPNLTNRNTISLDTGKKIKHLLQVTVKSIENAELLNNGRFGETDCYVSYFLPSCGPSFLSSDASLKKVTSQTCNSESYMKFDSPNTVCFILPENESPQGFLSRHLEDNSLKFELWRRFYYPNVRDQVYGRGSIPLHHLSHLMSLETVGEKDFAVPLIIANSVVDVRKIIFHFRLVFTNRKCYRI